MFTESNTRTMNAERMPNVVAPLASSAGAAVGAAVVGAAVGGAAVGSTVGVAVGSAVGGAAVGSAVGGAAVGAAVGGAAVGSVVAALVGSVVTTAVGSGVGSGAAHVPHTSGHMTFHAGSDAPMAVGKRFANGKPWTIMVEAAASHAGAGSGIVPQLSGVIIAAKLASMAPIGPADKRSNNCCPVKPTQVVAKQSVYAFHVSAEKVSAVIASISVSQPASMVTNEDAAKSDMTILAIACKDAPSDACCQHGMTIMLLRKQSSE